MNKAVIVGVSLICVIIAYYFFQIVAKAEQDFLRPVIAIYDGRKITMDDLISDVPPLMHNINAEKQDIQKQKFAYFIEKLGYTKLTNKFDINLSDEEVIKFANKKFNNVFNPTEKQVQLTEIYISALREVAGNKKSIRSVYDDYFRGKTFYDGKESITFDDWTRRVKIFGKLETIKMLENDLNDIKKGASSEKVATYRAMYISDALESSYCEQEEVTKEIITNLSAYVVTNSSKYGEQLMRQECDRIFYPWLFKFITDEVELVDGQYTGYEIYLSFHSTFQFLQKTFEPQKKKQSK